MVMTASSIQPGFEPIPGYVLREKLGAGGYGEVWLADAPGGLKKAIKFVHGDIDEDKATNELKSLQRIRQVNHPFILSLERIEVVAKQLVIVTELAHGSLHDRYVEFREKGFVGIPRDRLLGYLSDAAAGLDFLCQQHDLQHLDVKPANLLLVADRVKVADFGLLKDIQSNSLSVMGGLTPTYAAPEMFDGRPGRFSDQYSLAIVYQEMLTGTLPFRGRTTAQLANEHLHKAPNLEAVPLLERPILSKALAKKPQLRFSDCRELIKALERVKESASQGKDSAQEGAGKAAASSPRNRSAPKPAYRQSSPNPNGIKPNRIQGSGVHKENASTKNTDSVFFLPRMLKSLEILPTLVDSAPRHGQTTAGIHGSSTVEDATREHKALVIGLGGTGANALMSLRQKIFDSDKERLSNEQLGFLFIDTDKNAIENVSRHDQTARMPYHSLVHVPLKTPQYYRESTTGVFPQLSRRWVYNIPRSLQTEGVRPLGMLAFLDNATLVFDALNHALLEVAQSNGPDRFEERILVKIVASAHGGTGGALVSEIGFLLRQHATEMNVPLDIELILTCGAPHGVTSTDLAAASALACLTEIHHYFDTEGLHPSLDQLPPSQAINQPPFDHVTVVHGGMCGNTKDWESAIHEVSEYLYASTETDFGVRLASTRFQEEETNDKTDRSWTPWLSTVTIRSFEVDSNVEPVVAAGRLCMRSLLPWIATLNAILGERRANADEEESQPDPRLSEQIDLFVGDMFRSNQWTAQAWVHYCMMCLMPSEPTRPGKMPVPSSTDPSTADKDTQGEESSEKDSITNVLNTVQRQELDIICDQLAIESEIATKLISKLVLETRAKLADWIARRWLNAPSTWISLKHVLREIANKFSINSNSLAVVAQKLADKHDAFLESLYSGAKLATPALENKLNAMALEARFHSMASKMLDRMAEHIAYMEDLAMNEIQNLHRDIAKWAAEIAQDLGLRLDNSPQSQAILANLARTDMTDLQSRQFRKSLQTLAAERMAETFGAAKPTTAPEESESPTTFKQLYDFILQKFVDARNQSRIALDDAEIDSTQTNVINAEGPAIDPAAKGTSTMSTLHSSNPTSHIHHSLADEIDAARPYLVEFGGAIRNTILLPCIHAEQLDALQKSEIEDKRAAVVVSEHSKTSSVICLGEHMVLSEIIERVWLPSNEVWQLANRLLARVDVDWMPITN